MAEITARGWAAPLGDVETKSATAWLRLQPLLMPAFPTTNVIAKRGRLVLCRRR